MFVIPFVESNDRGEVCAITFLSNQTYYFHMVGYKTVVKFLALIKRSEILWLALLT